MVTTTGMMSPSSFAVFALKFLQKSMMLTPCGPSAVPTGGAGVALPAAIWSFTIACTFFAISIGLQTTGYGLRATGQSCWSLKPGACSPLYLFDLQEVQFD